MIKSINEEQKKFNFSLIGGDTTSSLKSSFTICLLAILKKLLKEMIV